MWYFSDEVRITGWWVQAWLNTSSSVSQTRSAWHLGSIPPAGAQSKEVAAGAKWPCCSTHLIPRFTASRLSDVSPLCGNTTHRANHCPPLVHHHSDIPFIIPSIHRPAPTPGSPAFMNWQRAATSMGYHANAGIQGRKTIGAILSLHCRPLRQQSDARSHENKSLLLGYFYRKWQWERESSGNGCRRLERSCKKRLFLSSGWY